MARHPADFNRMLKMKLFAPTVLLILLAGIVARAQTTAPAGATWSVTTADFQQTPGLSIAITDAGLACKAASGDRTIPWEQFLSAERSGAMHTPGGRFELVLATQDRVSGEPKSIDGQMLHWSNPIAGELTFDLATIDRIARPGTARRAEASTTDIVSLANGDEVQGILTGFVDGQALIQSSGGDVINLPADSITSIRFAATGRTSATPPVRAFRVALSDGSTLTVNAITLAEGKALLTVPGSSDAREIPAGAIVSIEQLNGPVAWLSSLPPASDEQTPFVGKPMSSRMDLTIDGEPIRFGDRTYRRGIGVHSRSRITWPLDGTYATFRTRYALDGDLPYANVTVRVKLDDKVVHEKADFVAGDLSPVLEIPLNGAKTLTLEVDYGKTNDVQDRFNWIEPALLKSAVKK